MCFDLLINYLLGQNPIKNQGSWAYKKTLIHSEFSQSEVRSRYKLYSENLKRGSKFLIPVCHLSVEKKYKQEQ